MEIHTTDMEDVIESYATMILPSDYGSVRIFAKLALTLCILTILVVCCYRAAGKIKVFLVAAFLATGELSFFLAYNVCGLGIIFIPYGCGVWKKDILHQLTFFTDYSGETGQQPAGAYGGDGACLFLDTGDEARYEEYDLRHHAACSREGGRTAGISGGTDQDDGQTGIPF